ncbi:MAG: UDP-glucose 4-epimerase GalE [Polyangia bacterium]|mgnify:CR=1 FL=1|jgi:UDP-glucose 4-epimerase|nr:UDP-glucose 4-epimerase GalE [Polyangia bacterium]
MILVVGGAGYVGSHMVQALLDDRRGVVVLDNLSTGHRGLASAPRARGGGRGALLVEGSLGDPGLLDRLFTEHRFAAVMHFAAFSLVGESVSQPLRYYQNNVGETVALLAGMLRHGVTSFLFSSTAAVYGEPEKCPIPEEAPLGPTNPYGATKVAVERCLADCDAAHGLRFVSLRYFNAAGAHPDGHLGEAHEPESHLIPIVLQVARGLRPHLDIFGTDYPTPDGSCLRDYVHVCDLAQAHLAALTYLEKGGASRIFNVGSSRAASVREVVGVAERVTGREIPVREVARRPGDPAVLVADSSRIRAELGWAPRYEELEPILGTAWAWEQGGRDRLRGR